MPDDHDPMAAELDLNELDDVRISASTHEGEKCRRHMRDGPYPVVAELKRSLLDDARR
jgi:hypothetical protein